MPVRARTGDKRSCVPGCGPLDRLPVMGRWTPKRSDGSRRGFVVRAFPGAPWARKLEVGVAVATSRAPLDISRGRLPARDDRLAAVAAFHLRADDRRLTSHAFLHVRPSMNWRTERPTAAHVVLERRDRPVLIPMAPTSHEADRPRKVAARCQAPGCFHTMGAMPDTDALRAAMAALGEPYASDPAEGAELA